MTDDKLHIDMIKQMLIIDKLIEFTRGKAKARHACVDLQKSWQFFAQT